jgi:hypothetical protein
VTDWFTSKKRHLQYFTGVSKAHFSTRQLKFIEYRKIAYGISVIVVILGVASFFHGFDEALNSKEDAASRYVLPKNLLLKKFVMNLKLT